MFVAGRRIDAFMAKPEIDPQALKKITSTKALKTTTAATTTTATIDEDHVAVRVDNASFSWNPNEEGFRHRCFLLPFIL